MWLENSILSGNILDIRNKIDINVEKNLQHWWISDLWQRILKEPMQSLQSKQFFSRRKDKEFYDLAKSKGLSCLVEVHNEKLKGRCIWMEMYMGTQ